MPHTPSLGGGGGICRPHANICLFWFNPKTQFKISGASEDGALPTLPGGPDVFLLTLSICSSFSRSFSLKRFAWWFSRNKYFSTNMYSILTFGYIEGHVSCTGPLWRSSRHFCGITMSWVLATCTSIVLYRGPYLLYKWPTWWSSGQDPLLLPWRSKLHPRKRHKVSGDLCL